MPLKPQQRARLTSEVIQATTAAQLMARGLNAMSSGTHDTVQTPFVNWIPAAFGDATLPARAWEAQACREINAASLQVGNHACRPRVCSSKRHGISGKFCRMLFWNWHKVIDTKTKKSVYRRFHGRELIPRWDGSGLPPILSTPPHQFQAALERNHPYHYKGNPGVVLGPRSNHDVGLLIRFVRSVNGELPELGSDAWKASVNALIETIVDHEFYCSNYAAKEEPHAEGLLHSLYDAKLRHDQRFAQRRVEQEQRRDLSGVVIVEEADGSLADRARILMQMLVSAVNRGRHIGFPQIYAYLRGDPNHYTSHQFVNYSFDQSYRFFQADIDYIKKQSLSPPQSKANQSNAGRGDGLRFQPMSSRTYAATHVVHDYDWRPDCLELFPLCFFIAGTDTVSRLPTRDGTWNWHEECDSSGAVVGRHPCYQYREADERSWVKSRKVRDSTGKFVSLRGKELCVYDHYRMLRLSTPWRIPILFGKMPSKPHADSTLEEKFNYAAFMLFLFRPWRRPAKDMATWAPRPPNSVTDDMHAGIYAEYIRWSAHVEDQAKPYYTGAFTRDSWPSYNTADWWACMVYPRLLNFDLILSRRVEMKGAKPFQPDSIDGFPTVVDDKDSVESDVDVGAGTEKRPEDSGEENAFLLDAGGECRKWLIIKTCECNLLQFASSWEGPLS